MTAVTSNAFDVDAFLRRPLTACLATNGPTVRPVWFLWEEGAFWVLTEPWARLFGRVRADPEVALVVDECDLVRQVIARGRAELVPVRCRARQAQAGPLSGRGRGAVGRALHALSVRRPRGGRCGCGWSPCPSSRTT
ncbi:hypothetical protein QF034_007275 [Streptomyces africanus]|uniref:Pyridoxamine 5'-phosphate oxidase N-terminal domain-containing protein n=1 Tax=Streptomyces africanus TaxID=231024 RepID=A0ABU0R2U8_9ACTN|nr:hypothetical protein [Streptomyces africanus]